MRRDLRAALEQLEDSCLTWSTQVVPLRRDLDVVVVYLSVLRELEGEKVGAEYDGSSGSTETGTQRLLGPDSEPVERGDERI